MEFKDYEQIQEKKLSSKRETRAVCDLDRIYTDKYRTTDEYGDAIKGLISEMHGFIYDYLVKMAWLKNKFYYDDISLSELDATNSNVYAAMLRFMRCYLNVEPKSSLLTGSYSKVESYFEDFYPDFDAKNPFEEKYEFPYKHINIDYLLVVCDIPVRLHLLARAEEKMMGYSEFLDYVWNWTTAFNDEAEDEIYAFQLYRYEYPKVFVLNKKYGRK
jgi:hypothetical protein